MGCASSKEESIRPPSGGKDFKRHVDINAVSKGRVEDHYTVSRELGRGTFSIVREATHKTTGKKAAVKVIDKKYVDKDDLVLLTREIDIMKQVSHKNVLSLHEIFETENEISMIIELVTGGELFFKIVEQGSYSEGDAAGIVRQILAGVAHLHEKGIAHRDLKPENLLCSGEGADMTIKIADFGLSKIFGGGQKLETSCGTPDYAAPEVLLGEKAYDKSVDLWSVGVITYVLLCGYPPFYAQSQPALFEKIIHANYDFPEAEWGSISAGAKDFVRKLLVIAPVDRMTVEQCLASSFMQGGAASTALKVDMNRYNTERKRQLGKMKEELARLNAGE